jgi:hypothetical protein
MVLDHGVSTTGGVKAGSKSPDEVFLAFVAATCGICNRNALEREKIQQDSLRLVYYYNQFAF